MLLLFEAFPLVTETLAKCWAWDTSFDRLIDASVVLSILPAIVMIVVSLLSFWAEKKMFLAALRERPPAKTWILRYLRSFKWTLYRIWTSWWFQIVFYVAPFMPLLAFGIYAAFQSKK